MLSRWMRPTTAVVILALATVRSAGAQSDIIIDDVGSGAQAAYFALTTTPVGALPSWVAYQLGSGARRGTGVRAHLGYIDEEGDFARRTLAIGVDFSMGRGTIGITGGYHDFACDEDDLEGQFPGGSLDIDCKGGFILGANWVTPLIRSPMGSGATTTFVLGLDVGAGLGTGDVLGLRIEAGGDEATLNLGATSFSAAVGIPLLLTARSGGVTFVPHLTPRVGFGHASLDVDASEPGLGDEGESESGIRAMLGGGLGILFERSGFGFDVGFQKVFVDEGKTMIGVGVRQLFGPRS